ncbi:MAG: hypothetical protein U5K27_05925 [Desulfotignum sp.]|nr:hypothetical protein [Desulfotignum sp.]
MAIQKVKDAYILAQTPGDTYQGDSSDQTYSINPNLVQAGDVITIIDQGGTNYIELPDGLEITSSIVTATEILLTLSNGAQINVRGAETFTFKVGQNLSAGDTDGTDLDFETFAQDILGVTVPAAGEDPVEGATSTVNDDGTATPGGDPSETVTDVVIDTAAFPTQTDFDASGDAYNFIDDAAVSNYAVIDNFSADDTISFVNADVDDYEIHNGVLDDDPENVTLTYNDDGTVNRIDLIGVVSSDALVYDLSSFTTAIGFDPFVG